ncbi:MAG: hypothetical protein P1V97_15120 [Planctomycetota bacterium]|nr:hypothetical protein [Planctomycetota bacterium]
MNESTETPKSGCLKLSSSVWSISIAGIIILFMAAIAGPKLIESRVLTSEMSAIGTLRVLYSSQQLYKEQGHANYGSLKELQGEAMKDYVLENDIRQGYRFTCQASKSQPSKSWWATAEPVEPGKTGERFFLITHKGDIYVSTTQPIVPNPDTGEVLESEQVYRLGSR